MENVAITSLDGKYVRCEGIGKGSFKSVFKAYNEEEGLEVAWNEVLIPRGDNASLREKMRHEVLLLQQLNHPNIIRIYDAWENPSEHTMVFITELMTSGTLKGFINQQRSRTVKRKIMIKFCVQILEGLRYLHSLQIIHRDLKCDNIFLNGNKGEVKIGDFGLSINKVKTYAESVIGTPEFMAPELYEEKYTEKVDIYSFGMCVLEMATGEYPYSECENVGQVFRKVTMGIKPKAVEKVKEDDVASIIDVCLQPEDLRPSAAELLAQFEAMPTLPPGVLENVKRTINPSEENDRLATSLTIPEPDPLNITPRKPSSDPIDLISTLNENKEFLTTPCSTGSSPIKAHCITLKATSLSPIKCDLLEENTTSRENSTHSRDTSEEMYQSSISVHSTEGSKEIEQPQSSLKIEKANINTVVLEPAAKHIPDITSENTLPAHVQNRKTTGRTSPYSIDNNMKQNNSDSHLDNFTSFHTRNGQKVCNIVQKEKLYLQEAEKTIIKAQQEADVEALLEKEEKNKRASGHKAIADKLRVKLHLLYAELEQGEKDFKRKKENLQQKLEFLKVERVRLSGEPIVSRIVVSKTPPPLQSLTQFSSSNSITTSSPLNQPSIIGCVTPIPKSPSQPQPTVPLTSPMELCVENSQREKQKQQVKLQALEIQSRLEEAIADNLLNSTCGVTVVLKPPAKQ